MQIAMNLPCKLNSDFFLKKIYIKCSANYSELHPNLILGTWKTFLPTSAVILKFSYFAPTWRGSLEMKVQKKNYLKKQKYPLKEIPIAGST